MKVLIVRTFPDVLNLNTYNVQEIVPAEDPVQNTMPAEAVPNS